MTIPEFTPLNFNKPTLSHLESADQLSSHLRSIRNDIAQKAMQCSPGLALAREYSEHVDAIIRRMLEIAVHRTGRHSDMDNIPLSVVATGGYGRMELCPHSDIDITFIPHKDGDRNIDLIVKEMFNLLVRIFIDANGMEVGYAYRLIEDCPNLDHQTVSGLMDARLIAGNPRLFIVFENDFWLHFNTAEFIFSKLEERRSMLARMRHTPRLIEPNVKEGAGGLRDLHTAVWLIQALRNLPAANVRGARAWDVLSKDAEVTPDEIRKLKDAKEFIFRVRNALHAITGTERDDLVVTRQEEVSKALGFETHPDVGDGHPPVEIFMRDYYLHASELHRICEDIFRRVENSRIFLGIGIDCVNRQIVPANPLLGMDDPVWMIWACEVAQRYELEFGDTLERAILNLLETHPVSTEHRQAADIFTRILASPRGVWHMLEKMATLGILGWMFPEVAGIMNLISYDPSHDYTVGQHTLYVIKNLDNLRLYDVPEELKEYKQVMAEIPNREQLYLAALLHDAGKRYPEFPHSEVGETLARQVCKRLFWDDTATENVCFLVRHHLLMAEVSRLRDLNLEETIHYFTSIVDDMDRLHMLYILTFADTNAVAPGIWNQVKGKFLHDLLRRSERVLAGEESDEYSDVALNRARRRLMKELSLENLPPDEVAEHVDNMPATYILNVDLNDIALHILYVRKAREGEPVIDFHDERNSTFTEVTICTQDDPVPGLLAKITGVFHASDLNVHSAQIFTRVSAEERIAIDSFYVDYRGKQLTSGKRKELATNLRSVLLGTTQLADLLSKRHKNLEVGGSVERLVIRNDLASRFTVIEITAPDDRSFFHRICGGISSLGWDIHSARVSLFRGRIVASLYVTGAETLSDDEAYALASKIMPVQAK